MNSRSNPVHIGCVRRPCSGSESRKSDPEISGEALAFAARPHRTSVSLGGSGSTALTANSNANVHNTGAVHCIQARPRVQDIGIGVSHNSPAPNRAHRLDRDTRTNWVSLRTLSSLCYLLGYSRLHPLFHGVADTDLIREQRDFLVRVAASLKNRPANLIVQRLANASSSDRLAGALTALGRIVKTIFVLRYLFDSELRHRIQLQLTRRGSSARTSRAPPILREPRSVSQRRR
ncbi:MAG: Tn3 family transposase [Bryobacteraceae bacterium]